MLNFLGAIASLFPGYLQGQRQAVQDNWQDLQNYNNIQLGQLNNAFTEATFQPRLDMVFNNARRDAMGTLVSGWNTALHGANFPRSYNNAQMGNVYGPAIDALNYMAQRRAYELATRNPGLLLQGMAGFQTPSGV